MLLPHPHSSQINPHQNLDLWMRARISEMTAEIEAITSGATKAELQALVAEISKQRLELTAEVRDMRTAFDALYAKTTALQSQING